MDTEIESWTVLHAAGVSGTLAGAVADAGGPGVIIERGTVAGHPLDVATARQKAALPTTARAIRPPGNWRKAPLVAFARGGLALEQAVPAVAVVGSRNPTARGLALAFGIARELAEAGAVVVSGGANGIDTAAHTGAIHGGGRTIAVLGQPAGQWPRDERPVWMRELFDSAHARTLTVTTSGPWVRHDDKLFVARNRHIAGLASAVLVVEGAARSGTRYTVAAARSLRMPIWAIVGDTMQSEYPNDIVDDGTARALNPLRAVEQLLALPPRPRPPVKVDPPEEPEEADEVVLAIRRAGGRASVDDVARALGQPARELLPRLGMLEIDGKIAREGGFLVCRS